MCAVFNFQDLQRWLDTHYTATTGKQLPSKFNANTMRPFIKQIAKYDFGIGVGELTSTACWYRYRVRGLALGCWHRCDCGIGADELTCTPCWYRYVFLAGVSDPACHKDFKQEDRSDRSRAYRPVEHKLYEIKWRNISFRDVFWPQHLGCLGGNTSRIQHKEVLTTSSVRRGSTLNGPGKYFIEVFGTQLLKTNWRNCLPKNLYKIFTNPI